MLNYSHNSNSSNARRLCVWWTTDDDKKRLLFIGLYGQLSIVDLNKPKEMRERSLWSILGRFGRFSLLFFHRVNMNKKVVVGCISCQMECLARTLRVFWHCFEYYHIDKSYRIRKRGSFEKSVSTWWLERPNLCIKKAGVAISSFANDTYYINCQQSTKLQKSYLSKELSSCMTEIGRSTSTCFLRSALTIQRSSFAHYDLLNLKLNIGREHMLAVCLWSYFAKSNI